jgi:hypothetical protein
MSSSNINPLVDNLSYDRITKFHSSETPDILGGKEEAAPEYLFNTY